MRYSLHARISTEDPAAIQPVLIRLIPRGTVTRSEDGREFVVDGVLDGASARDLNRSLLSELRRAEKRTRLRSEWTGPEAVERFFDYVPKGSQKLSSERTGPR
jgi:hypothetical protein